MKPTISFVLQLSSSTAYENLESVARSLLDGLDVLLESGLVKCSLFFDGPTLEMLRKVAKPLAFGRIKTGIDDGVIEFLGGGFHDPMLSLFPEEMQIQQLQLHKNLLKKSFDEEPQGYFNSSLMWDMGMASVLEKAGFDYALVSEDALQEALGRTTPISGWYSIEDKGSLMRVIPVASSLSKAIENDDLNWREIASLYCRDRKPAVVMLDLPPQSNEIVVFFERLVDFVETNDVQTWPVGYIVNQLPSEGAISYLISAGRNLGLPSTVKTCREMLIRRPEINLLQKSFLNLYRRAKECLDKKSFVTFCDKLLPVMSPIFFRDLGEAKGMQSLNVREWGYRYLLTASKYLDDLTSFSGVRLDVCDFLLLGKKLIWAENKEISGLLDYYAGGTFRSLNHKISAANFLNAWRDDGEPSLAFSDCLLPNVDLTATQVELVLAGRENLLKDPYDYQIKRMTDGAVVELQGEQGFSVGNQKGVLHIDKCFKLLESSGAIEVSYKISNTLYMESKKYFGTRFDLGLLEYSEGVGITIDGSSVKWDKKSPFIYPEAKNVEIKDFALGCKFHLSLEEAAAVFVGPIYSATNSAAPDVFQGICVYPFWKTDLNVMNETQIKMKVSITKR